MKMYLGSGGIAPSILTSSLHESEWYASRPGRFNARYLDSDIQWMGGWLYSGDLLHAVAMRANPIISAAGIELRLSSP